MLDTGSDLLTCGDLYSRGIWTGGMCLFRNNGANLVPINGHMNLSCVVSSNRHRRFLHTNTHTCTQYPSIPNCWFSKPLVLCRVTGMLEPIPASRAIDSMLDRWPVHHRANIHSNIHTVTFTFGQFYSVRTKWHRKILISDIVVR